MSKSFYDQIIENIGHDYLKNYELLEDVSGRYDLKELLSGKQYMELGNMRSACIQINFFKEELGLDISEVDIRKYVLDDSYRGRLFDLQALKKVFEKAEKGDMESIMFLASAFHDNQFSPALSRYASKWCEKGAEGGNINAMLSIGSFYRWGEGGVFVDAEKAIYWYGKAAKLGNEDAIRFMEQFGDGKENKMLELSAISGTGGVGTKWYKHKWMIEKWFEKADGGDAECQYEVGRQLMPGTGYGAFRRSTKESIKYYEMAARQGVVDAMFNLASAYQDGWSDLEIDPEKEFYWRKQAADAGDIEASYMLGKMYIEGNGTYEDFEEGLRYLKTAADSDDAKAWMVDYYKSVCRIEKIYEENREQIVPLNSDFYSTMEKEDRGYLQEYLNRIMYDLICAKRAGDGEYVLSTYIHVVTLIELAVRVSEPVGHMSMYEEHTDEELDMLVKRFLYHYLDAIGDDEFYDQMGKCAGVDEKKCRKECHELFWQNAKNSILSVQKDFPDFMQESMGMFE